MSLTEVDKTYGYSSDKDAAAMEYLYAAKKFLEAPGPGTRYALRMAVEECELLGVNVDTLAAQAAAQFEAQSSEDT